MKKQILGQLLIYVNKNKQDLKLYNSISNKLNKLGYKVTNNHLQNPKDYFFACLDKDKKTFWTFSSITGPASMANAKLRPIPINWMNDLFNIVVSRRTTFKELSLLEKLSFKYFSK